MALLTLPASPNWYISHTVGFNKSGLLVFAARHDVFIYDASTFPIAHKGVYCGHREKVTCVTLPSTAVDPNQMLCCSGSEDGKVFIWDVNSYELLYETEAHVSFLNIKTNIIILCSNQITTITCPLQAACLYERAFILFPSKCLVHVLYCISLVFNNINSPKLSDNY